MDLRRPIGALTGLTAVVVALQSLVPHAAQQPIEPPVLTAELPISTGATFAPADLVPGGATQPIAEVTAPSVTTRPTPLVGTPEVGELAALAGRSGRGRIGTVPTLPPETTGNVVAEVAPSSTAPMMVVAAPAASDALPPADTSVLALPSLLEASRASTRAKVVEAIPDEAFECHERAAELDLVDGDGAYDENLVAQMTHSVFRCRASVEGYDGRDANWGDFEDLAELVAAEAVVVSYCESVGYRPSALTGDNPWGYGGLFQMGAPEMRRFGFSGASKFDPVDNAYAAATYFLYMNRIGGGWGGWGPWAVVNTGYNDDVNNQVKVPVLPRFASTDAAYRGRRGADLPAWAIDPWSFEVPSFAGCPVTGGSWPEARLLS